MERYSADYIRENVSWNEDRLFAPWAAGRPENWTPDQATKDLVCLGYWLREELTSTLKCNEADVKTQLWKFNRLSRTYDIWETAAECLNDVLDDKVERNRKPHRRWG